MTQPDTTTTVTVGEGGLGAYIAFADAMADTCQQGFDVCETTLADMQSRGWGGPKTEGVERGQEQLAYARSSFQDAAQALREALGVAEQYAANPGAGDRESVTNI